MRTARRAWLGTRGAVVLAAIAALLATAPAALCTPDAATWTREVLLGTNSDHYFLWVAYWSQKGDHYSSSATTAIRKVRLADFDIVQEIEVSSLSYRDEGANDSWDTTAATLDGFDLSAYLRENRVIPVFPGEGPIQAVVEDSVLYLEDGENRAVLLTAARLRDQVGVIGSDPHVVGRYDVVCGEEGEGRAYYFYVVQFNSRSYDDNWSEVLVVVSSEQDQRAWEEIQAAEEAGEGK